MDIARHIGFAFSISPYFSIILLRWAGHLSKEELRDIHTRSENDRYRVHIRELEGDIEVVTRIDKSCCIMDDQA
jgi:activator of HSP90 ATPase